VLLCHRQNGSTACRPPTDSDLRPSSPGLPLNGCHPRKPCNYMDHYSFADPEGRKAELAWRWALWEQTSLTMLIFSSCRMVRLILEVCCRLQIESVSSADIDSLVTSISLELSQQKANLERESGSPIRHQEEPRFVLDKNQCRPQRKTAGVLRVAVIYLFIVNIVCELHRRLTAKHRNW